MAVLALWDIPRRSKKETPLALRPLAGLPLVDHVLRALTKAKVKKIVVVSTLDKASEKKIAARFKGLKFLRSPGAEAGKAFRVAARQSALSGQILLMDGLCPHADSVFLRKLLKAKPKAPVLKTDCGHACGEEHAALARMTAKEFKRVFAAAKPPAGLEAYLEKLRKDKTVVSSVLAPYGEDLAVRDVSDLAEAATLAKLRLAEHHMSRGVEIVDPENTWIDEDVIIGRGSVVLPYSFIQGKSRIGSHCVIGPFARMRDTRMADHCRFEQSVAEDSRIRSGAQVGPWSRLRAGSDIGPAARVGNFCEFKNAKLASGVKAGHLSYLGDAFIGADSNIGAGTITANYDGKNKNKTTLGAGVFTGSHTVLVAPLKVGAKVKTGAGSVVLARRHIAKGQTVVGAPARIIKKGKK